MLEPLKAPIVISDLVELRERVACRRLEAVSSGRNRSLAVQRRRRWSVGGAAPLRAGARVAEHEHVGYEQMLVLEGDEFDEHGSYPAGSFVINPPGTRHSPGSKSGCMALLIYEKAVRFVEPESSGCS